jgi:hypothetical protein
MGNEMRTLILTGEGKPGEWQGKTIHKFTDTRGNEYSVWDSDLADTIRGYLGAEASFDVRTTNKNGKTYLALDGVRDLPKVQGQGNGVAQVPPPVAERIRIAEIAASLALIEGSPDTRVQYLLDVCRAVEGFVYDVRFGDRDEQPPDWHRE